MVFGDGTYLLVLFESCYLPLWDNQHLHVLSWGAWRLLDPHMPITGHEEPREHPSSVPVTL